MKYSIRKYSVITIWILLNNRLGKTNEYIYIYIGLYGDSMLRARIYFYIEFSYIEIQYKNII
jgi:hypothetical protein